MDVYNDLNGIGLPLGDKHNPLIAVIKLATSNLSIVERIHQEFSTPVVITDGHWQYLFFKRDASETLHRLSFDCPANDGYVEVMYYDCLVPMPPSYAGKYGATYRWSDESLGSLLNTPVSELPTLEYKKALMIGKLINSPTVETLNTNLPNDEKFNGKLGRKDKIDSFLGSIYRNQKHYSIEDTTSQVLDFDLNNFPNASYFLGGIWKTINRETNALSYVAEFNANWVKENGEGAYLKSKIDSDEVSFNDFIPIEKAHEKIIIEEVPQFNKELIPPLWKGMTDEICESEGTPHQALFMSMFTGLGACAQGNTIIKPKPNGEYQRRTNVVLTLVANSGSRKSDVIRMALREIFKIDTNLSRSNSQDDLLRVFDTEKKIEMLTKEKSKPGADIAPINEEIKKLQDELIASPLRGTKFLYGNATVQKMISDAKANQKTGFLMVKDELKQIFADMMKKGNEDYRNFYMHGFDGNAQAYKYSTKLNGDDIVEKLVLSMISGVQPDVLSVYIKQLYGAYGQNDGFMQRIVMIPFGESRIVDASDLNFLKFAKEYDIFNRVFGKEESVLSIHPDAMKIYDKYLKEIKIRAKLYETNNPLCSVLSKHQGFLSSFAAIYEFLICDRIPTSISKEALELAFRLLEYIADCAKYLFKVKDRQEDQEAVVRVAKLLSCRHFRSGDTQSQWIQNVRGEFKYNGVFYNALSELEIRGYICMRNNRKGSVSCWVNPKVYNL
jgi:hypothetical protein